MSLTQWKVLNQLKEYYNKYSNDKNFQHLFNKELASILQKIQPSVYGSNVRNFETTVTKEDLKENVKLQDNADSQAKEKVVEQLKTPTKEGYTVSNVLSGLRMKMSKTEAVVQPKWKTVATVSKCSVTSRTSHVISMITNAESEASKLRRIEDLIAHIQHFPEAKHQAFKVSIFYCLIHASVAKLVEFLFSIKTVFFSNKN